MNFSNINTEQLKIGSNHPPFIIAEMSGNHNQSLERAMNIVDAAAAAGVNAIKLQTYTADTITLDVNKSDFTINEQESLWKGQNLHNLYKLAYTPWEWHKPIMKRANELGLICFSSPFDETSVDFLETLDVPIYKIASFENNHLPLLRKVAATGKPIIISTGMASLKELEETVSTVKSAGCDKLILLKCTSNYPASPKDSNILTIPDLRKRFDCQVGLSDHTMGLGVSIAAIAHGATVIEKHFTLDRNDGGVDSEFSMEPSEMSFLVTETKRAWQSLGEVKYGPTKSEESSLKYRRSLYISQDIRSGEVLSEKNLRVVRPGFGLHPRYFEELLGTKVLKDIKKGEALNWRHVK
jgi:pseudaminic acid synthase|tara:strand:+ start:3093 stop:4151 length:1059 start_codon:yes stop_codon:yes gene_type:complete